MLGHTIHIFCSKVQSDWFWEILGTPMFLEIMKTFSVAHGEMWRDMKKIQCRHSFLVDFRSHVDFVIVPADLILLFSFRFCHF